MWRQACTVLSLHAIKCVAVSRFGFNSFCTCGALQSIEARESDLDATVLKMLLGDQGKPAILSVNFGRQTKDLQATAVSGFAGLLKKLNQQGELTEGADATEKGRRHQWFHVQGMFWCPKLDSWRQEVQDTFAQLVYNFAGMPRGQNYYVYCEFHWLVEQPHVS
jgi:hypothetical protein